MSSSNHRRKELHHCSNCNNEEQREAPPPPRVLCPKAWAIDYEAEAMELYWQDLEEKQERRRQQNSKEDSGTIYESSWDVDAAKSVTTRTPALQLEEKERTDSMSLCHATPAKQPQLDESFVNVTDRQQHAERDSPVIQGAIGHFPYDDESSSCDSLSPKMSSVDVERQPKSGEKLYSSSATPKTPVTSIVEAPYSAMAKDLDESTSLEVLGSQELDTFQVHENVHGTMNLQEDTKCNSYSSVSSLPRSRIIFTHEDVVQGIPLLQEVWRNAQTRRLCYHRWNAQQLSDANIGRACFPTATTTTISPTQTDMMILLHSFLMWLWNVLQASHRPLGSSITTDLVRFTPSTTAKRTWAGITIDVTKSNIVCFSSTLGDVLSRNTKRLRRNPNDVSLDRWRCNISTYTESALQTKVQSQPPTSTCTIEELKDDDEAPVDPIATDVPEVVAAIESTRPTREQVPPQHNQPTPSHNEPQSPIHNHFTPSRNNRTPKSLERVDKHDFSVRGDVVWPRAPSKSNLSLAMSSTTGSDSNGGRTWLNGVDPDVMNQVVDLEHLQQLVADREIPQDISSDVGNLSDTQMGLDEQPFVLGVDDAPWTSPTNDERRNEDWKLDTQQATQLQINPLSDAWNNDMEDHDAPMIPADEGQLQHKKAKKRKKDKKRKHKRHHRDNDDKDLEDRHKRRKHGIADEGAEATDREISKSILDKNTVESNATVSQRDGPVTTLLGAAHKESDDKSTLVQVSAKISEQMKEYLPVLASELKTTGKNFSTDASQAQRTLDVENLPSHYNLAPSTGATLQLTGQLQTSLKPPPLGSRKSTSNRKLRPDTSHVAGERPEAVQQPAGTSQASQDRTAFSAHTNRRLEASYRPQVPPKPPVVPNRTHPDRTSVPLVWGFTRNSRPSPSSKARTYTLTEQQKPFRNDVSSRLASAPVTQLNASLPAKLPSFHPSTTLLQRSVLSRDASRAHLGLTSTTSNGTTVSQAQSQALAQDMPSQSARTRNGSAPFRSVPGGNREGTRSSQPHASKAFTPASMSMSMGMRFPPEQQREGHYNPTTNRSLMGEACTQPTQPPESQAPVQVLCSEGFLDTWGDIATELGSGMWPALVSDDGSAPTSVGRPIELFDSPLVDQCGVDIELPNRCAIIVYTAAALESTEDAKVVVLNVARLVASGRYKRLIIFLCYDVPISNAISRHVVQLQMCAICNGVTLPTSTFFKTATFHTLSAVMAETIYYNVGSVPRESLVALEVSGNSNFRRWAQFLLAMVPNLCAWGALQCLLLSKPHAAHSQYNALGILLHDAQVRRDIAEFARSRKSPHASALLADALEMLTYVLHLPLDS